MTNSEIEAILKQNTEFIKMRNAEMEKHKDEMQKEQKKKEQNQKLADPKYYW